MRGYRMKAHITVFAALIITLVMSLVCVSIRSAVDTAVNVRADMAANLAIESIFANYSRPLADEFNILLLPDSDSLEAALAEKVEENCSASEGFGTIILQSVSITDKETAVDSGGSPFAGSVLKYMQYGVFSEFSQLLMQNENRLKKESRAGELINEITECEEDVAKIDSLILDLIRLTEGLDSEDGYLKGRNDRPVCSGGGFVKRLCPDSVTPEVVCVYDERVFREMRDEYIEAKELLAGINEDACELDDADDDTPQSSIRRLEYSLSSTLSEFSQLAGEAVSCCEAGIQVCDEYLNCRARIREKASGVQNDIEVSRGIVGDDIADALSNDVKRINEFSTEQAICDAAQLQSALKEVLPYFMILKSNADRMSDMYERGDYSGVVNLSSSSAATVNAISYDRLEFDYSNVEFKGSNHDKNIFSTVKNAISKGIMGIVFEDEADVSDKDIEGDFHNLAVEYRNNAPSHDDTLLGEVKNVILYDEYVLGHFRTYADVLEEDSGDYLDYQVEYILNGCASDYDNLYMTVLSLSGLRECANLMYLFTDSSKRQECYALASALFGFAGMPALVTVAQYTIMALWAYGESLMEVKTLLAGGRAELVKSAQSWQLSLENLMSVKFENEEKKGSDKGLDYEQFLRLLLLTENRSCKYFRTMTQIELWMIKNGFADFRMKNQISSLYADIVFKAGAYKNGRFYSRPVQYSY